MSSRVPKRADKHQGAARLLHFTPRLHLPAGLAHSQTSVPDCRIDQVKCSLTTAFSLLIRKKENPRKSTHKIFLEITQIFNNSEDAELQNIHTLRDKLGCHVCVDLQTLASRPCHVCVDLQTLVSRLCEDLAPRF